MFRKFTATAAGALLGLAASFAAGGAQATTLSGDLTADNAFYVYVSTNDAVLGTLVASGNAWPTTFSFSVPLAAGTYYLQVEAINYGGPAGFIGDFTLSGLGTFSNASQTLLTDTTDWVGIYNDGNSDPSAPQSWVEPTGAVTSFGANGVGPWGTVSNISSNADWIWPADANSLPGGPGPGGNGACGFCTVDLSTAAITVPVPEPSSLALMLAGLAGLGIMLHRRKAKFFGGSTAA